MNDLSDLEYPELFDITVIKTWGAANMVPQVKALIEEQGIEESAYVEIVYFDDPDDGPVVVSVSNSTLTKEDF